MEPAFSAGFSDKRSKRILVIEDDPFWQTIIRRCILNADRGSTIRIVENATEFRSLGRDRDLDLIIADHWLGEGPTGLEIWQEFRGEYPNTPFLLASGLELRHFLQLMEGESSPPSFVEKSLVNGALAKSVREILNGRPASVKTRKGLLQIFIGGRDV